MNRATWKKAERRVAKALGGQRVPFSGGLPPTSGLPATDVMGTVFRIVEVKHRKTWQVQAWVRDCRDRAGLDGNWLLVVGTPAMRGQYAVLPLERLADLLRAGPAGAPNG